MKNIETIKKEDMNLSDKIYIFDTTLRDGEQTPGVALTVDEKMQIAQKLNNLGVDKIEVGFPASSKGEIESAKRINSLSLDSTLVGLARSLERDIDAVIDFLIRAKRNTYAGKAPEVKSCRLASHDLNYEEGAYSYYDTYLGGECFSGEEAVW